MSDELMTEARGASCETTLAIEQFLNDNYLFRRNVLNGKVEFATKPAEEPADESVDRPDEAHLPDYRPLTQEALNSIIRRAKKEQVCEKGSPKTEIMEFVHSEDVPVHNPIGDYLKELPAWDGQNHITPTPKMKSIVAKDLTKQFGTFTAVNHINFEVEKGEIFGFLGANGAGKTTAIKMMSGLLLPTSGDALIGGYSIKTESKQIKKHIGYMSQRFSLYNDLTVFENMQLFGTVYGIPPKELKERINDSLDELMLLDKKNALVASIPLGWKQKLAFATAILHRPEIVFLDEPTSGVDPIVRREFWKLIYQAAAQGITIFVTTHYMDEAEYCNRISIMSDGCLKLIGTPDELKQQMGVNSIDEVFVKFVNR